MGCKNSKKTVDAFVVERNAPSKKAPEEERNQQKAKRTEEKEEEEGKEKKKKTANAEEGVVVVNDNSATSVVLRASASNGSTVVVASTTTATLEGEGEEAKQESSIAPCNSSSTSKTPASSTAPFSLDMIEGGCKNLDSVIFVPSQKLIGKGGTCNVYFGAVAKPNPINPKERGPILGLVAVKEMNLGLLFPSRSGGSDLLEAQQKLNIISKEYDMLQKLVSSPYVVKVFKFEVVHPKTSTGVSIARIYMELLPKGTLRKLVKSNAAKRKRLHEVEIRAYMKHCLRGLAYLHEQGILHRDIKPENILLVKPFTFPFSQVEDGDDDVLVKLSDFGTCKYTLHGICATTVNVVGTVPYMSPEAIRGKFSFASDIWAIAISFLELATEGNNCWAHLDCRDSFALLLKLGELQPPHHLPPIPKQLSQPCQEMLLWCLQRDASRRPSAVQLLQECEYFRSEQWIPNCPSMEPTDEFFY